MAASIAGFKTKASLKKAVKDRGSISTACLIDTSIYGNGIPESGNCAIVGPSPYVRKWYANVTISEGKIVKVT